MNRLAGPVVHTWPHYPHHHHHAASMLLALHQLYYDPNIDNKNLAQKWLMQAQVPEIQYFGASALHTKISRYWADIPADQYESLKSQLFSQIACFSLGLKMVLTRLCVALASLALNTCGGCARRRGPDEWSVFRRRGAGRTAGPRCLAAAGAAHRPARGVPYQPPAAVPQGAAHDWQVTNTHVVHMNHN
ncbi:hypothetical protein CRUP_031398 [Coryphaenoides rupestris]|nr:hypothetical protein CRUP_031398 [Coryphaenoides rupestris]